MSTRATSTALDERPKRLSLSQILELLLTRSGAGDRSSVTLSQNAAGVTQIEVKVRTGDDDEIATVDAATEKATAIYDKLRRRYPGKVDHDNAAVTFTRNAKGDTQIAVEVKTSPGGLVSLEGAAEHARAVYDNARDKYPTAGA